MVIHNWIPYSCFNFIVLVCWWLTAIPSWIRNLIENVTDCPLKSSLIWLYLICWWWSHSDTIIIILIISCQKKKVFPLAYVRSTVIVIRRRTLLEDYSNQMESFNTSWSYQQDTSGHCVHYLFFQNVPFSFLLLVLLVALCIW